MSVLLELSEVEKRYGKDKTAVSGVSLEIQEGEFWILLGANGAGKSTLLSVMAAIQRPSAGRILYRGKDIRKEPGQFRAEMGYVPQETGLYQVLPGMANLRFFAEAYHLTKTVRAERIEQIREIIGLSREELDKKVITYSGGMKQRLNVGVALIHTPKLLLLDEPMAGVDEESRKHLLQVFTRLNKEGVTVVMIEHNLHGMDGIPTHAAFMEEGKLLFKGGIEEWNACPL